MFIALLTNIAFSQCTVRLSFTTLAEISVSFTKIMIVYVPLDIKVLKENIVQFQLISVVLTASKHFMARSLYELLICIYILGVCQGACSRILQLPCGVLFHAFQTRRQVQLFSKLCLLYMVLSERYRTCIVCNFPDTMYIYTHA